jgi:D-arabinose 1-dehydrogenase-like Zn-dependent alcohol dehydrogenase
MPRSVRIHEFGGPDVLKIEDVAVPDPSSQEVRLRIRAIGLNRSEVLTRSGRAATKPALPGQLGLETAFSSRLSEGRREHVAYQIDPAVAQGNCRSTGASGCRMQALI